MMIKVAHLLVAVSMFSNNICNVNSFYVPATTLLKNPTPLTSRQMIGNNRKKLTGLNHQTIFSLRGGIIGATGGNGESSYLDKPHLHLAGQLLPSIKNFFRLLGNCGVAGKEVLDAAFIEDWLIMTTFWALCDPAFRVVNIFANRARRKAEAPEKPFEGSLPQTLSFALRGLVRMMMTLYIFELGVVAIAALGIPIQSDLPGLAATVAYPWSMAKFIGLIKEWGLGVNAMQLEVTGSRPDGKMLMYNRLADTVLAVMATVISLDVLSVKLGVAISSILAVGGLSSVVVALACKEPLTQIVYGLLVIFNDKFRVGEAVKVGDVGGKVVAMGWFDTLIRRPDESVIIIPNGQMMTSTITNLSRQSWGQYKTEIRIRYDDMDKVEHIISTLKERLKNELEGDVILPPVRNLWVHWRSFGNDSIILVIDLKLREMDGCTRYFDLREKANYIIADAVKECGATFAVPTARKVD